MRISDFGISENRIFIARFFLLHIIPHELLDLIKRYDIRPVIKICVDCTRYYHQFLVVCIGAVLYHISISVPAEIAGMGFFAVYQQYGAPYLIAVS